MKKLIENMAYWCLAIGIVFVVLAGWNWVKDTGSVNVVDLRGCVLPQYYKNRVQIENIMKMQGYSEEMVSLSFNCY